MVRLCQDITATQNLLVTTTFLLTILMVNTSFRESLNSDDSLGTCEDDEGQWKSMMLFAYEQLCLSQMVSNK